MCSGQTLRGDELRESSVSSGSWIIELIILPSWVHMQCGGFLFFTYSPLK